MQTAYSQLILQAHPDLYWILNEPTGASTAIDSSGNALNGTYLSGSASSIVGPLTSGETAAFFNGSSHISNASITGRNITADSFSLEAWVKCGTAVALVGLIDDVTGDTLDLIVDSIGRVRLNQNGGTAALGSSALNSAVYTHIALVVSSGTPYIYKNGVDITISINPVTGIAITSMFAGLDKFTLSEGFTGDMSNLAVYNSILSPATILAHYNAAFSDYYLGTLNISGVWKNGYVGVNGVNLSDHAREIALDTLVVELPSNTHGDKGERPINGLTSWVINVSFFQDFAAGKVDDTLRSLYGCGAVPFSIEVGCDGFNGVSLINPRYSGQAILDEYKTLEGAHGTNLGTTAKFVVASGLTRRTF